MLLWKNFLRLLWNPPFYVELFLLLVLNIIFLIFAHFLTDNIYPKWKVSPENLIFQGWVFLNAFRVNGILHILWTWMYLNTVWESPKKEKVLSLMVLMEEQSQHESVPHKAQDISKEISCFEAFKSTKPSRFPTALVNKIHLTSSA